MADYEPLNPNWVQSRVLGSSLKWVHDKYQDLSRQSKALVKYVREMGRPPDGKFLRRTTVTSNENYPHIVDACLKRSKAGEPFLGAFATASMTSNRPGRGEKYVYVAKYPGYAMTDDEYEVFSTRVHCQTAIEIKIKKEVLKEQFGCEKSIIVVGDPIAPGCNVMSVHGAIKESDANCKLAKNSLADAFVFKRDGSRNQITDVAGLFEGRAPDDDLMKAIKKGDELICLPYSKDFFDFKHAKFCSWCFYYRDEEEEEEEEDEVELVACSVDHCGRYFHKEKRCKVKKYIEGKPWKCYHHDNQDHSLDTSGGEDSEAEAEATPASSAAATSSKKRQRSRSARKKKSQSSDSDSTRDYGREYEAQAATSTQPRQKKSKASSSSSSAAPASREEEEEEDFDVPVNRGGRPRKEPPKEAERPPSPTAEERPAWIRAAEKIAETVHEVYKIVQKGAAKNVDELNNPHGWVRVLAELPFTHVKEAGEFVNWCNHESSFNIDEIKKVVPLTPADSNSRWMLLVRHQNTSRNLSRLTLGDALWTDEKFRRKFERELTSDDDEDEEEEEEEDEEA